MTTFLLLQRKEGNKSKQERDLDKVSIETLKYSESRKSFSFIIRVAVINFITGTKTLKAVIESIYPIKLKERSIILEWNPSSDICASLISPLHHEDLPQI